MKRIRQVVTDTSDKTSYPRAIRNRRLIGYLHGEKGMTANDIAKHLSLREQDVKRVLQNGQVKGLDVR